ncbi:MAG: hypothetical protein GTO16_09670 [Candidatus Aminicenantes bacterium]|nr:hypothetical protein [Candidatus Aminicenantes bacterium]
MIAKYGRIFSVLFIICFCFSTVEGSVSTLPLEQIKAGMKGKGKTVFEENKIEEFDVEILDVLYNIAPKRNIILVKLKGEIFDKAGVIQGMSGSPVYVGGKLIGAVAYSIGDFAKEAIAGITPIEEMLSIEKEETAKSSYSPLIPFKKNLSLEELFEINKEFLTPRSSFISEGQTLAPLGIPLVFSGFSSNAFEKAKMFFSNLGFYPVRGGPSGQSLQRISSPDLTLHEGDPVAVQLVRGDIDLSAVGTVTHVDGNKVFAFGHSLYNLGPVDYVMSKARVITVVPRLSTSFKISSTDALLGSFVQDRIPGVFGKIGKVPKLVPVNVQMTDAEGNIKNFKIEVVTDKILTPALVNLSLASILSFEERALGDLSLELRCDVYLENGMSVHLEDLFSGSFNTSGTRLSNLIAAVVYFLINNEFTELGIHRIDLSVHTSEEAKFSYLEKVWLDKYEVSPGERIRIKVYHRTFRGTTMLQEVGIFAPQLPSSSEFQLVIGDAASMAQVEMSQYKLGTFIPRSLNQLIRVLNNLRKNNRIYFKIIASKPGIFLKGEEMPNLPPTMKSMFSSPRAAASSPTELNKSTLSEYQLPLPYVFKGAVMIPIKIKR